MSLITKTLDVSQIQVIGQTCVSQLYRSKPKAKQFRFRIIGTKRVYLCHDSRVIRGKYHFSLSYLYRCCVQEHGSNETKISFSNFHRNPKKIEAMASDLNTRLSKKTNLFGLQVWELIGIGVGLVILSILCLLSLCLTSLKKKSKKPTNSFPLTQIPTLSKEIKAVEDNITIHMGKEKSYSSESGSFLHPLAFGYGSQSGDEGSSGTVTMYRPFSSSPTTVVRSPLAGLPNVARLGWGYWFTLRELDLATNLFSQENVIGEGGYGVVYRGCLLNGTPVAVKKILNSQ